MSTHYHKSHIYAQAEKIAEDAAPEFYENRVEATYVTLDRVEQVCQRRKVDSAVQAELAEMYYEIMREGKNRLDPISASHIEGKLDELLQQRLLSAEEGRQVTKELKRLSPGNICY